MTTDRSRDRGTSTLSVWCDRTRVGELASERGDWSFAYTDEWIALPDAFPLSPWFPLASTRLIDRGEDRRVEWYFDNLLPEGGVRRALASYADLDERGTFGLLRRFGEESAGALVLLPTGEAPYASNASGYEPLTRDDLRGLLAAQPRVPLLAARGRAKMSLAGAQHKLGVRLVGDEFFLPVSGAASSHILKPDNAHPEAYPFCPANEHFVMCLAHEIGLSVPQTTLFHLPEPVYVVERYDRWTEDAVVRRRHQIDLCQLGNKWPSFKYEEDGGATLADVFGATERLLRPAASKNNLLRWLVFNYIVGNSDAHAKNVSFLVSRDGFDLAPFYDLLSVKVYGDDTLAMTIGGEERYGLVTSASWDALADRIGIRPSLLRRIRRELARDVPRAAAKLVGGDVYSAEERAFLEESVLAVVREHAGFVSDGL